MRSRAWRTFPSSGEHRHHTRRRPPAAPASARAPLPSCHTDPAAAAAGCLPPATTVPATVHASWRPPRSQPTRIATVPFNGPCRRLSMLLLSNNLIHRVSAHLGAVLPNLTALVLTANRIASLAEVSSGPGGLWRMGRAVGGVAACLALPAWRCLAGWLNGAASGGWQQRRRQATEAESWTRQAPPDQSIGAGAAVQWHGTSCGSRRCSACTTTTTMGTSASVAGFLELVK